MLSLSSFGTVNEQTEKDKIINKNQIAGGKEGEEEGNSKYVNLRSKC